MRRLTFTYSHSGVWGCLSVSLMHITVFNTSSANGYLCLLRFVCANHAATVCARLISHRGEQSHRTRAGSGRPHTRTRTHRAKPPSLSSAALSLLANNREDDLFSCALMSVLLTIHPSLHAPTVSIICPSPVHLSVVRPSVRPSTSPFHPQASAISVTTQLGERLFPN